MTSRTIRVLALAIVQREDGRILLERGFDDVKQEAFYRIPGGGVEFGETGAAALAREFEEELGRKIENIRYLGLDENIFEFNGEAGHQIILVYAARFADAADMALESLPRLDRAGEAMCWRNPDDIAAEGARLYPRSVAGFIAG